MKHLPPCWRGIAAAALILRCGSASVTAQQDVYPLESANPAVPWQINPAANVTAAGTAISRPGFSTTGWTAGLVPGTAFVASINAGLEGADFDPNYGANIYNVATSKYDQNFWYRTQFTVPAAFTGKTVWLNFDGINKSGDIYFNGTLLGSLYGFMQRGKYNVTSLLNTGQPNALAILTHWESAKPIQNYGSPTYMSCIGWDWMPYVPGRETGVTDHVYLTDTQGPALVDPWIRTTLNSTTQAQLAFTVGVNNPSTAAYNGTVTGIIQPGNVQFSKVVSVPAGQTVTVSMAPSAFPQLTVNNPLLWWPNGYGAPNLYTCEVKLTGTGSTLADDQTFNFGIRQFSYDTTGGVLHLSVNGTRIFVKGGNWGMSEYLLRCRGAEYDTKLRFHADMNMNMIRNWEGSVTDHEFYDACDKYGLMVWDDFWMNSLIGDPNNMAGYNNNVIEKIRRLRNHPCIAVWCGMNEGTPDTTLTGYYTSAVTTYDGNDRLYQPNSHAGNLSGSGYWALQSPSYFFTSALSPSSQTWGFRTEIGVPVFPTYESFQQFMPPADQWPADAVWNDHFWGSTSPNASTDNYTSAINSRYGTATGIQDYCAKAQLLNIETNKAMFEGFLDNMWNDASGIMTWMSQSAYPSMIWQTYDYYYDLTGAYWGVKKACEPVHIQWNPATSVVKVVNTSSADATNVTAQGTVYNKDGTAVPGLSFTRTLTAPSDTATSAFHLNFNASNLAYGMPATASSTDNTTDVAGNATDGAPGTRWSSSYNNNQWIYVDLGAARSVREVILRWEGTSAYGKAYQIQVSNDASVWTTVYATTTGAGGVDTITFNPVTARYVKMNGQTRGSQWGFSLYEFEVYGAAGPAVLSDVHFIKLALNDSSGNLISDNFYWRGSTNLVYTGLNTIGTPTLQVSSQTTAKNGQTTVTALVVNPASSPAVAFAVRLRLLRDSDGTRILPAMMSENYFTLFRGESKTVTMTFDSTLLGKANPTVVAQPYNAPLAITSASTQVFNVGLANTFAVAATGLPAPSIGMSGALPAGVTFVDHGNGTATLSGNSDAGASGSYPLGLTAHNSVNPDAAQTFTLVINHPPVAGSASLGTTKNTPVQTLTANFLASASDPDGDALSVGTASTQGGVVSLGASGSGGTIIYTPAINFVGSDRFVYTLGDGRGGTTSGTASVTVSPAGTYTINAASVVRTATAATVAYNGLPGAAYQPQYTDSLGSGPWTDDGPPLIADSSGQFTYIDKSSPLPPRRFYRIRSLATP